MVSLCHRSSLNIFKPGHTVSDLADKLNCSSFQAALLEMRGVSVDTDQSIIKSWLSPDMEKMLDSLDLGGTSSTAAEIFRGLNENSDVIVYGDYDVDGISATTIAMQMVIWKRARVRYFIPHRFKQGYGLHEDVARVIAKRKCDLLIVVDCGTQNAGAVKIIRNSGIPVVVLDHHLIEGAVAECDTMVNPQLQGDCLAKKLCAAAVIWCWAWQNELIPRENLMPMLDLVALATIADCVSLSSPLNRALVRKGMEYLRRTPRPGLAILMEKLMISRDTLCTEDLAMKIIPCLNAAGRLSLADEAVNIFFRSKDLPLQIDKIIALNRKRRELSTQILTHVNSLDDNYKYVLTDENWSVGVLSSVASRICNERKTPVALVAKIGDIMRGTLRMPSGGDAVGILSVLSEKLNTWGGHRLAAGFSVKEDQWQQVRDEMEDMLSKVVVKEEKEDYLYWNPAHLDIKTWLDGQNLGPFGMDNPAPGLYFPYKGVCVAAPLGRNGKHVKIDIGGVSLLGFGAASIIRNQDDVDGWIYKPRLDTWRGGTSLQFVLDKIVVSERTKL